MAGIFVFSTFICLYLNSARSLVHIIVCRDHRSKNNCKFLPKWLTWHFDIITFLYNMYELSRKSLQTYLKRLISNSLMDFGVLKIKMNFEISKFNINIEPPMEINTKATTRDLNEISVRGLDYFCFPRKHDVMMLWLDILLCSTNQFMHNIKFYRITKCFFDLWQQRRSIHHPLFYNRSKPHLTYHINIIFWWGWKKIPTCE